MQIKLDEKYIRNLSFEPIKQKSYFDTKIPGFHLKVGKRTKTFCIQRTVNYKSVLTVIGRHPEFSLAQARNEALKIAVQMKQGINPNQIKKTYKIKKSQTLRKLLKAYQDSLKAQDKLASFVEYEKIIERHFIDWTDKPLDYVNRDKIEKRHSEIGEYSGKNIANKAFRILRALYNFYSVDHPEFINPVIVLSQKKLWFKEKSSTRRLAKKHEFKNWYKALKQQKNKVIADYLLFVLYNGLRKKEAMSLQWNNIDFVDKAFVIKKTKNGKSHELPLSTHSLKLLKRLKKHSQNSWVFSSMTSASGHMEEPKKVIKDINKIADLQISTHDLRRTFLSIGTSLNINSYTLKRLINHSTKNDVTAIYAIPSIDELREPIQKISDRINNLLVK